MTALRLDHAALLDLVEAAYDSEASGQAWVRALLKHGARIVPGARTSTWFEYAWSHRPEGLALDACSSDYVRGPDAAKRTWLEARRRLDPRILARLFGRTTAGTASQLGARGVAPASVPGWRAMWREPVVDSMGLVSAGPDGRGMCLSIGLFALASLGRRETTLLERVAVHLGSGHRLRARGKSDSMRDAEAILSPRGKLLHAEREAAARRDALDDGRRRRDEARKTRHDAERAMEIWQGLVAGRWSLVDYFDTDGKRFILAMRNAPDSTRAQALAPQEKRVVALAAMGHRDKEIAYQLGLSVSAVAAAMKRARAKLGAKSRAELATTWRRLG